MVELPRRQVLGLAGGMAAALSGCAAPATERSSSDARTAADHIVTTTGELESAFDALSEGDTIRISTDNAPYRTTRWLDIDVDGVTVVGPDVNTLIKPADGANVGGIRVGHHAHCENIDIRGIGYHGNPAGQDGAAKWLHGIVVRDAENVTIEGNYVTRTHPYHEHGSGGSGISVEYECRDVRVLNNRVYDVGDRGIQLAGDGITVSGNIVTEGLDRSISCDVWFEGTNYQARNVSVVGNILGNNLEGSLTGIGGGNDSRSDRGNITISGNVGFGYHKSFCHVGFDGTIGNIQIDGNISTQSASNRIAGVSVETDTVTNIAIRNNDLYGYSGRGINVEGGVSNFTVTGNSVYDAGEIGIRVVGAADGTIENNHVDRTGLAGIVVDGGQFVTVNNNRLRRTDDAGIVLRGGSTPRHKVAGNSIRTYGVADGSDPPAIIVRNSGNLVRGNYVHQSGAPAIVEADGAGENLYEGNWADGSNPWRIASPTSLIRNHTPGIDVHRGLTADDSNGRVTIAFEKPYGEPPKLEFGRVDGGVRDVSYTTTEAGNYDGAEIEIGTGGGTVDVFVEPA